MKKTILTLIAVFCVAGTAYAIPMGNALQGVLDNITNGGPSSVNVQTDSINDVNDSYWNLTATGGSVSTMIIELAAFAPNNLFGVYNNGNYVELFDGAASPSNNAQVTLSILLDGSVLVGGTDSGKDFNGAFGYYLDSSYYNAGGLFHSDTTLNVDEKDHMLAYQGTGTDTVQIGNFTSGTWTDNEYILAFEDLTAASNTDWDFTDMVVMVESVSPVPEPGTLLLLGAGLIGLAYMKRRKEA